MSEDLKSNEEAKIQIENNHNKNHRWMIKFKMKYFLFSVYIQI